MVLDIGNSAIKAGIFGPNGLMAQRLEHSSASEAGDKLPHDFADMLTRFISETGGKPTASCICSVVPGFTVSVAEAAEAVTGAEPMILTHETETGLKLDVASPEALGADRFAGALGAFGALGAPVAVVDFGTATTVGFVYEADVPGRAVFGGGAIMPGLELMAKSLGTETAQLPVVDLGREFNVPGRNTEENILAGIVLGTAGAVERLIAQAEHESAVGFRIAVTGGMANVVAPRLRREVTLAEPWLTLYGLRAAYEAGQGGT